MVSRELKQKELDLGISAEILAIDGLAVIVNPKNSVDNLSKAQVKDIFSGKITKWEDLGK